MDKNFKAKLTASASPPEVVKLNFKIDYMGEFPKFGLDVRKSQVTCLPRHIVII